MILHDKWPASQREGGGAAVAKLQVDETRLPQSIIDNYELLSLRMFVRIQTFVVFPFRINVITLTKLIIQLSALIFNVTDPAISIEYTSMKFL